MGRRVGFWRVLLAGFLGAVLAIAGVLAAGYYGLDLPGVSAEPPATAPAAEPAALPAVVPTDAAADPAAVGAAVIPAVVTVETGANTFRGVVSQGSGSGVILDGAGHIVTNDHVVGDADSIQVILSDGRVYPATLLGANPVTDLAVLKITATGLTPIEFGTTSGMRVGDTTIAVGSPLGLDGGPSLTVGVLSAFGREVQTSATSVLFGMLQTDAPISPGSSGGALVDAEGRLIGITTAVGVSPVGIEGIGFAIPVEVMERVVDDIIDDGIATNGLLGINGSTDFVDTSDGGSRPTGVVVEAIEAGSAAAVAGLELGDVITAVDGTTVDTMDELVSALRRFGGGDVVSLQIDRGGSLIEVAATLGSL